MRAATWRLLPAEVIDPKDGDVCDELMSCDQLDFRARSLARGAYNATNKEVQVTRARAFFERLLFLPSILLSMTREWYLRGGRARHREMQLRSIPPVFSPPRLEMFFKNPVHHPTALAPHVSIYRRRGLRDPGRAPGRAGALRRVPAARREAGAHLPPGSQRGALEGRCGGRCGGLATRCLGFSFRGSG